MRTVPGHPSGLLPAPVVEAVAAVDRRSDDVAARETLADALETLAWDVAADALSRALLSVREGGAPIPQRSAHRIADRARWSRAYTADLLGRFDDGDRPRDPRSPGSIARAVEFRSSSTRRRRRP